MVSPCLRSGWWNISLDFTPAAGPRFCMNFFADLSTSRRSRCNILPGVERTCRHCFGIKILQRSRRCYTEHRRVGWLSVSQAYLAGSSRAVKLTTILLLLHHDRLSKVRGHVGSTRASMTLTEMLAGCT